MKGKVLLTLVAAGLGSAFLAGTAFAAVDLKLNPDVLRIERDDYYHMSQDPYDESYPYHDNLRRASDIFVGASSQSFTFADVKKCLDKYGIAYSYDANEGSDGVLLNDVNLYIGVAMDQAQDPYLEARDAIFSEYNDTYDYYNAELNRRLNEAMDNLIIVDGNSEFEIYFTDNFNMVTYEDWPTDMSQIEAFIERVEIINGGAGIEGWKFQDGAWRYYVNSTAVKGWQDIDGKRYYFKDDTSMMHSGLLEVDGRVYSFSEDGPIDYGWQTRNPGDGDHWYYFGSDGAALTGWQPGIEGDGYKYFFWTDGYTDKNGQAHYKGSEAIGNSNEYEGIYQNGNLCYLADGNGHLLVNTEMDYEGRKYKVDSDGNCTLDNPYIKPYVADDKSKNYSGEYSDFLVVNGFQASYVRKQIDNVTCTAFSDLLVGKITGQTAPGTDFDKGSLWSSRGALWVYTKPVISGSADWSVERKLREVYARIIQGVPVIVRCDGHSVVAVGVRQGTDPNSVSVSDILIGDSWKDKVMTLKELGDLRYSIYKQIDRYNLIIPNGANPTPLTTY